jgi:hypothetical protein
MADLVIIEPKWRNGQPFEIYRNPGARECRLLMRDQWRSVRFVLAGNGLLFVGRSHEFMHHDSHTMLTQLFDANPFWSGEIILDGPHFPHAFGGTLSHSISLDDPRNTWGARHIESDTSTRSAEYNQEDNICLARMSHYSVRERGILEQSRVWQRFVRGLRMTFPGIAPLDGFVVNQPIDGTTRAMVFLSTDGNLYHFPHDIDHWEAGRRLQEAERRLYRRGDNGRYCEPVVGIQLGGNGNMHVMFSDVSHPIEFLRDNKNFRDTFGDADFDITRNDKAIATFGTARSPTIPKEELPQWIK